MTEKKKIFFIINKNSGRIKKILPKLEKEIIENIDKSSFDYTITKTSTPEEAKLVVEEASNYQNSVVVAVGGDGTVNKTINLIAGKGITLGIIPLGSGNALARDLKIPLSVKKALKVINKDNRRKIDLMLVNNKYYGACVGGIGFDALIAEKFEKLESRGLKNYIRLTVKEYFNYDSINFTLEIGNERMNKKAFLVSFANTTQYGNNAYIAPDAKIDDGIIEIVILNELKITATPGLAAKLFLKKINKSKYVESHRASSFRIHTNESKLYIHLDGESIVIEKNFIEVKNKMKFLDVIHNSTL